MVNDIDTLNLTSAYDRIPIGGQFWFGAFKFQLIAKYRVGLIASGQSTCPYCKSHKTYHSEMSRLKVNENIYRYAQRLENDIVQFNKHDLCLKCGREWVCELFMYKIIDRKPEKKSTNNFVKSSVISKKPWWKIR